MILTRKSFWTLPQSSLQMGVDLFVLDDGWFGKRDNDCCSLGDWTVNYAKLKDGLKGLSQRIHDMGLSFGLWIEPEMVSEDSDLYRSHPDWCLRVPRPSGSPRALSAGSGPFQAGRMRLSNRGHQQPAFRGPD